ncbi:hypothetical protein SR1949_22020 [Sphaerospermopsis reniformis]|uniref:Uncharacterized protein n=1 Tax=Sphaerospermopsis reniformis TaxID=531300 RepID=A0A479ZWT8_9CYAN|nr:hypothetical protein NIES73_29150 [Sphaerospermopsis kisseleviana NIES-73]GCL37095.1 hypothetical protein SR1949_22020 [Sphaerospermopsis reniformis]
MNDSFSRLQEWLTVFAYLGFTLFIIWRIFTAQNK